MYHDIYVDLLSQSNKKYMLSDLIGFLCISMWFFYYVFFKEKLKISAYFFTDVLSVKIFVNSPVCFGSKTIIKSEVSSTTTPEKIEWQKSKDGIDFHLIGKPDIYLESTEHFKNPFLVIPKTTFADKLFYRLWVWNRVGNNTSNTLYLNVTGSMALTLNICLHLLNCKN